MKQLRKCINQQNKMYSYYKAIFIVVFLLSPIENLYSSIDPEIRISPNKLSYADAIAYCAGLGDIWRITTAFELKSIQKLNPNSSGKAWAMAMRNRLVKIDLSTGSALIANSNNLLDVVCIKHNTAAIDAQFLKISDEESQRILNEVKPDHISPKNVDWKLQSLVVVIGIIALLLMTMVLKKLDVMFDRVLYRIFKKIFNTIKNFENRSISKLWPNEILDDKFKNNAQKILKEIEKTGQSIEPSNIQNIKELGFPDLVLDDIRPLAAFRNLSTLVIKIIPGTSLSPLSHLLKLNVLQVTFVKNDGVVDVSDVVSEIGKFSALKTILIIDFCSSGQLQNVRTLAPLAALSELKYLELRHFSLQDATSLGLLPNKLQQLKMSGTNISSLCVSPATCLSDISLNFSAITRVPMIPTNTSLKRLDLSNNKIENIESISELSCIEVLDLSFNPIDNFDPLRKMESIRSLTLNSCGVKDISFIKSLKNLTILDLKNPNYNTEGRINTFTDLTPLSDLLEVTTLNLQNTNISDLSPLANMTKLKELKLPSSMNSLEDAFKKNPNVLRQTIKDKDEINQQNSDRHNKIKVLNKNIEQEGYPIAGCLRIGFDVPTSLLRFLNYLNSEKMSYRSGGPEEQRTYINRSYARENEMNSLAYFIICSQSEAELFTEMMKKFRHPRQFYDQIKYFKEAPFKEILEWCSDYDNDHDEAYKMMHPSHRWVNKNAIILTAKTKFKEEEFESLRAFQEQHLMYRVATSQDSKPYKLSEDRSIAIYERSSERVFFSKDFTKCILFGSTHPLAIPLAKTHILETLPFCSDVDIDFLATHIDAEYKSNSDSDNILETIEKAA